MRYGIFVVLTHFSVPTIEFVKKIILKYLTATFEFRSQGQRWDPSQSLGFLEALQCCLFERLETRRDPRDKMHHSKQKYKQLARSCFQILEAF